MSRWASGECGSPWGWFWWWPSCAASLEWGGGGLAVALYQEVKGGGVHGRGGGLRLLGYVVGSVGRGSGAATCSWKCVQSVVTPVTTGVLSCRRIR